jgi:hypothetical protein
MRFRSERERQLAAEVIRQMLSLVDSLQQRMSPVQTEADLQGTEAGRLLLDAVCILWIKQAALPKANVQGGEKNLKRFGLQSICSTDRRLTTG